MDDVFSRMVINLYPSPIGSLFIQLTTVNIAKLRLSDTPLVQTIFFLFHVCLSSYVYECEHLYDMAALDWITFANNGPENNPVTHNRSEGVLKIRDTRDRFVK